MSDLMFIASLLAGLAALALGGSILAFQFLTGVPPVPAKASEMADVVALLRQARLAERATVYELGSGWGSLVMALATAFPDARIVGIERSPLPYWVSRLRTRSLPNVHLRRADFYDVDIRDAHAVTCYLMIRPMRRLASHLDRMLAAGTPVVSVTFLFRDREPGAVRKGRGLRGEVALYSWSGRPVKGAGAPPSPV